MVVDEPNVAGQASSTYATELASDIMEEIFPYLGVPKAVPADAAEGAVTN